MRKTLLVLALGALVLVPAAGAHVTLNPNEVPADSFSRFAVRVPTERPDADTTKVVVQLPLGLFFVSFQPKPGWTRTVTMEKLDPPVDVFGEEQTERIATVTWEGGKIAPGEFDEFGMSAKVPNQAGQTLVFPAVQTYSSGEVVRWIGAPDADEPAPRVTLGAKVAEEAAPVTETTAAAETEEDDSDMDGLALGVRHRRPRRRRRRARDHAGAEAERLVNFRLLSAALLAALVACPAAAGHGDGASRGYTSAVTTITPDLDGLTVQVLQGDDQLHLRNDTGQELVIEGYDDEPYLRFDADGGVFRNANSPATYLNQERYGGVDVPATASKSATPSWERVSSGRAYEWHDHRIHWMSTIDPPKVRQASDQPHHVFDWNVPGTAGGKPLAIRGTLDYQPPPAESFNPILIAPVVALALAGAIFWWVRRRRET